MSTITTFVSKSQAVTLPKTGLVKAEQVIDFALVPCASGDVVQMLNVPEKAVIFKVAAKVITAEAGTHTIGLDSDPNGFFTALDSSSTGYVLADGADKDGVVVATANTVDITLGATMDSGKISISVLYALLEE
jgi:hypothetical protein